MKMLKSNCRGRIRRREGRRRKSEEMYAGSLRRKDNEAGKISKSI